MIVVLCALRDELPGFARSGVAVVPVGIGPVEAAIGTARALAAAPYRLAINAGIGGGFRDRARVGEAVAVTAERYVELGREDGTELALPAGLRLVASAAGDPGVLERCRREAAGLAYGTGVTSATVTTTDARALALADRFAAYTESMEGFAVLRAAEIAGVPALEVRGISNLVGDRATSGWDFRAGAAAAVRALGAVLDVVDSSV